MIHVLATIELHPGKRAAFLEEFHALIPLVQAELGCIEYGSAIHCPTPISAQTTLGEDTVVVIEKWSDVPALQAHLVAPHMGIYREKVKGYVKNVSLQILQPSL
jgi:quinol monooxygenase YgiN